jgi:predicted PhzF superfamily epimerase YddE/YHI9
LADGFVTQADPYLIVPTASNFEHARIVAPDFEALLATVGAKFVYVLEINDFEGRTWENDGSVEDIATGSAAGPAAVYLVTHGCAPVGDTVVLAQGRFYIGQASFMRLFRQVLN